MDLGLIHTGLLLFGAVIAWAVGGLSLYLAKSSPAWGDRRSLQLLCLGAPLLVVGVLGGAIGLMIARGCQLFTLVDTILSFLILAACGAILFVSLGSTAWRSWLARRLLSKIAVPSDDERTRRILNHLATRMGVPVPRLAVCDSEHPLACLTGVRKPMIVLSSWMLASMDDAELEAILAHELVHLRNHDNLIAWLAAWLKEGVFYLPTANHAWAQFQGDREVIADAETVRVTGKPMALASALVKVWEQGLSVAGQRPHVVASATAHFGGENHGAIEARVQRLLGSPSATLSGSPFSTLSLMAMSTGVILAVGALLPLYLMPSGAGTSCLLMAM